VFLLNRRSEIRFSPRAEELGKQLALGDPGCVECHGPTVTQHTFSIVFTNAQGARVFRNCKPILNQPECQACHSSQDTYNGVLVTDLSMASVDDLLAADLTRNVLWSALAILATIVSVNTLMSRMVVTRLERLVGAIRGFPGGELSWRMPRISRGDEIGDLAESFDRMAQQVIAHTRELERLNAELQRKDALRGQLLAKLITVQEEERKRIARDLHDQTLADLRNLALLVERLPSTAADARPNCAPSAPTALRSEIESISQEVRRICEDLSPSALENVGLSAALQFALAHAVEHAAPDCRFEYEFTCDDALDEKLNLPSSTQIQIYRIAQEALSNICRHANAKHVKMAAAISPESEFELSIADDGRGFDEGDAKKRPGRGVANIRARASMIDADVEWKRQNGGGTVFRLKKVDASRDAKSA
jgi:signal transduction histidine kinase